MARLFTSLFLIFSSFSIHAKESPRWIQIESGLAKIYFAGWSKDLSLVNCFDLFKIIGGAQAVSAGEKDRLKDKLLDAEQKMQRGCFKAIHFGDIQEDVSEVEAAVAQDQLSEEVFGLYLLAIQAESMRAMAVDAQVKNILNGSNTQSDLNSKLGQLIKNDYSKIYEGIQIAALRKKSITSALKKMRAKF